MSYLIKTDYGDLKFIVHSSGLETKKKELTIEKARYKEEKINRIR